MFGEFDRIADKRFVSADDVLTLRRAVFSDGIVDRNELSRLFEMADRAPDGDREWYQFFCEATADFFLREEAPNGYFTAEEFALVHEWVLRDGHVVNRLELEMMIGIMKRAVSTPIGMAAFVSEQITDMIRSRGQGAKLSQEDTETVRSFLFAAGGENSYGISREEANLLFDLNDATAGNENHPDWQLLFSKAVAAHLMQYAGFQVQTREDALARHEEWQDTSINVGGFLANVLQAALRGDFKALGGDDTDVLAEHNDARRRAIEVAEEVTSDEAKWLEDRFAANGELCDAEKAVLLYMRDDLDACLPANLSDLIKDVA